MHPMDQCAAKVVLAAAADRYNTDPATATVSLQLYEAVRFFIQEGAGATGTAVVTAEECTAADGSDATAIAFRYRTKDDTADWGAWQDATAAGFTTTAGADQLYEVRIDAAETSDLSPFVRLQLTEGVDSPVAGAVIAVAEGARYAQEPPITP